VSAVIVFSSPPMVEPPPTRLLSPTASVSICASVVERTSLFGCLIFGQTQETQGGDEENNTRRYGHSNSVRHGHGRICKLVLMALKPGEEIGEEVHPSTDRFFRVEKGKGEVRINGEPAKSKNADTLLVPRPPQRRQRRQRAAAALSSKRPPQHRAKQACHRDDQHF
jgi:mannose-6-phosphate isomerase-like protein (cupin superfamily)